MATAVLIQKDAAGGVTRNLSEVFMLLRSNAQQNKFVFTNTSAHNNKNRVLVEEKLSLVSLEEGDFMDESVIQQTWIHTFDEVEFEFGRIRSRLDELATVQRKHISRPNFGDEAFDAEEKGMEMMTEQITSMMTHCQRLINMMSTQIPRGENFSERKLRENALSALVFSLSQLANDFRSRQSKYLNGIKSRCRNLDNFLVTAGGTDEMTWGELVDVTPSHEYTMDQIQQMMINEQTVREREKEVLSVNSSILELNTLFKDLSSMIIDQGTLLDRIDYNVEQASIRVKQAGESVKKAENYQKGDKKMHCICCLTVAIMVVLLLIIFTKF